MDARNASTHPLARKLGSIFVLSRQELEAVSTIPGSVRNVRADEVIVREGDRPIESCLVLEGFACRFKHTEQGKRQIFSFHIPGDIPDLQSLHIDVMDHSLGTLTACKVMLVSHDTIRDLCRRFPRIADAFWRDTHIDAAVFRQWLLGLGRKEAAQRIAHLLCELYVRLRAIGLANNNAFSLPLTQAELGDALGLSTVHVNRSLQKLRTEGFVESQGRAMLVSDWEGLKKFGEFDPTYLHLWKDAA